MPFKQGNPGGPGRGNVKPRNYALSTQITSSYFDKYQLRPWNPAELWQKFGWRVYDEMREDDQIAAILDLKKNLCIQSGYEIECEDQEVKDFICWNFENINFTQSMYEILSGMDYGFSITEKNFARMETPEWGELICLESLWTRAPHSFKIVLEDDGRLKQIYQIGVGYPSQAGGDIPIPAEKVLHYIHNAEFSNPYGQSELNRGVYVAWWAKKALYKFWGMYLERFGMPTRVAQYGPGVPDAQQADLQNVINNMQAATGIVVPEGIKLEFIQAQSAGDGFKLAIDQYNLAISRKMGLPDLMGFSGEKTGGGSYALGDRHYDVFLMTLQKPREVLESIITRGIIKPLVELNFGPMECEFCFKPISDERKLDRAKFIAEAVQKGALKADLEVQNYIRGLAGIPDLTEEDLAPPEAPPAAPTVTMPTQDQMAPGDMAQAGEKADQMPMPDAKPMQDKPVESEGQKQEYAAKDLPPLKFDRKVDYTKIKGELDTAQEMLKKKIGQAIKDSITQIMPAVQKIVKSGDVSAVPSLDLPGWDAFGNALADGMRGIVDDGFNNAAAEVKGKRYIAGNGWDTPAVEEFIMAQVHTTSDSTKQVILNRMKNVLIQGVRSGDGIAQITAALNSALEDYDSEASAAQLETIARTNLSTAYNEGRAEYFKDAEGITGYEFSAVMDDRTSEECQALHGSIIRPNEMDSYNPPIHFNCRSILVPITDGEDAPEFTPQDDLPDNPKSF